MASNINYVVYLAAAIVIIIIAGLLFRRQQRRLIKGKIEGFGASLLSCNSEYGIFGVGPFKSVSRYQTAYKFKYLLNGQIYEGWVKFSIFSKPDWRM